MPAKLTLTKNFGVNHGGYQSNGTENVNFVPTDVQNILSSHKISKKYNEMWDVLQKNLLLKTS